MKLRVRVEHNEFYMQQFFHGRKIFLSEQNKPLKFRYFFRVLVTFFRNFFRRNAIEN